MLPGWLKRKRYHSRFGGLWTDRLDAEQIARKKLAQGTICQEEHERLLCFIKNGYVILRGAVPDQAVDDALEDIEAIARHHRHYIMGSYEVRYTYATQEARKREDFRGIDFHVNSTPARGAIFNDASVRFLRLIFGRDPLAFQNLYFAYGSQQEIHQDPAYVVCSSPLELAATWVALEDVEEGSGELVYYRGSHRYPDFLFSGKHREWNLERDGLRRHEEFLESLHSQAEELGCPLERFLPRKGDVLVWAADLAHGGAEVTNAGSTRRSLVTHFCPIGIRPHYFATGADRVLAHGPHCHYSSRYYDLKEAPPESGLRKPSFMVNMVEWTTDENRTFRLFPRGETSIRVESGNLVVTSRSDDPGFYVEADEAPRSATILLEARLESEHGDTFQVFHLPSRERNYTERQSVTVPIDAGANEIRLTIGPVGEDHRLRIDPGRQKGKYVFQSLKIVDIET